MPPKLCVDKNKFIIIQSSVRKFSESMKALKTIPAPKSARTLKSLKIQDTKLS